MSLNPAESRAAPIETQAPGERGRSGEQLPLPLILSYGLPVAPIAFMGALASLYLLKFTADVLLIAPATFATIFALSKVWDAVSDPIVGYLSDRTRLAAGRRRPWIFAAAFPMGLTFWAVWSPPDFQSEGALTLWIGCAIILYYTAYTLAYVPHLALGAELSNDHHERTRVFGGRGVLDVVGLLAAAGTVGWMQTSSDPRAVGQIIALLFAPVAALFLWTGVARIRERPEYQGRGSEAPFRAFLDVGRNPHARILLGVLVLESLSFSLLGTMFPFVTQYLIPDRAVSAIYVVAAIGTAMVAFPVWFPLARRFGKRTAWLAALTMKSVGFVCMLMIGPDTMWLFPVAVLLIGAALACSIMLPPSIKSDVIDYDELVTGERKEGAYFAAWNFTQKLASAVAIGLSGVVLQIAGYEANSEQSESSIAAIRILFSGVPLALHIVAIALLLRFRLNASEHQKIRAELDRRQPSAS